MQPSKVLLLLVQCRAWTRGGVKGKTKSDEENELKGDKIGGREKKDIFLSGRDRGAVGYFLT